MKVFSDFKLHRDWWKLLIVVVIGYMIINSIAQSPFAIMACIGIGIFAAVRHSNKAKAAKAQATEADITAEANPGRLARAWAEFNRDSESKTA